MPQGVYPEWKDKAQTKKHPASGLSKNKYDAKGNLRPQRKSRAKEAFVQAKADLVTEGSVQKTLLERKKMFEYLKQNIEVVNFKDFDPDDINTYLDNPSLMISAESGEWWNEFKSLYQQSKISVQSQLEATAQKRYGERVRDRGAPFGYTQEEPEWSVGEYKLEPKPQPVEFYKDEHFFGRMIRGASHYQEDPGVDEDDISQILTHRGKARVRARRSDYGMTREEYAKDKVKGLQLPPVLLEDRKIINPDPDKTIALGQKALMDDFFSYIGSSEPKHMTHFNPPKYAYHKTEGHVYDWQGNVEAQLQKTASLHAPLYEGHINLGLPDNPPREITDPTYHVESFLDSIGDSGKRIAHKINLTKNVKPVIPTPIVETAPLPSKPKPFKKIKFKIVEPKDGDSEWKRQYANDTGIRVIWHWKQKEAFEKWKQEQIEKAKKVVGEKPKKKKFNVKPKKTF